ncbi:131_t:CDS:1 [Gigaspora margarita]|uniref:131_t:CDS:1 n=1 Tax=Gigaspora margarita TaxID=4874 RepID=A0ABN7VNI0_GIGMA|nr:131_t:CDS:1 [Gigaspora margarita]
MSARALKAAEKTKSLEFFIAIIAAIKKVLSPISETTIISVLKRKDLEPSESAKENFDFSVASFKFISKVSSGLLSEDFAFTSVSRIIIEKKQEITNDFCKSLRRSNIL